MKERVGVGVSYDLEFRELIVLKQKVQIYYLNGQVSDLVATEIIKKLIDINDDETNQKKLFEIVENRLSNLSVVPIKTMDEAVDQMLSGLIVVFVDGDKTPLVIVLERNRVIEQVDPKPE